MASILPDSFWTVKSWVESANDPILGFPLQSLAYCSFVLEAQESGRPGSGFSDLGVIATTSAHLGIGIGTYILDLHALTRSGLLSTLDAGTQTACTAPQLNALLRCGPTAWSALRQRLFALLSQEASPDDRKLVATCLIPRLDAQFLMPVAIPNYTDFYASIHHATNVGRLFRPDQPLLPNYHWLPIGYHGRASSIVISGTPIRRPQGQIRLPSERSPTFQPSTQLDYELEVAAFIGTGNPLGTPIPIAEAEQHIFGLSLLNDWSARDIQTWEYQPLGPFLGKSFATSISPWVVPMDALRPFRAPLAAPHDTLVYLAEPEPQTSGIDLTLKVLLSTARMREASLAPAALSTANLRDLHWSFAQMVTHHTSNGCNLLEGDLLATGTVSGPQPGSQGCLLEITQRGTLPIHLPNNETRTFLEDGDEIILRGHCHREGLPTVTLGECRGTVLAASSLR
jgi:fumarylacetoacetase